MPTETAARPDLTRLAWDVRLRICVAETQGATWERETDGWWLAWPRLHRDGVRALLWFPDDGTPHPAYLPDYPGDPGAWEALQREEKIKAVPHVKPGPRWVWEARHMKADTRPIEDAVWDELGASVSFAVLAKHAHPDLAALLESRP